MNISLSIFVLLISLNVFAKDTKGEKRNPAKAEAEPPGPCLVAGQVHVTNEYSTNGMYSLAKCGSRLFNGHSADVGIPIKDFIDMLDANSGNYQVLQAFDEFKLGSDYASIKEALLETQKKSDRPITLSGNKGSKTELEFLAKMLNKSARLELKIQQELDKRQAQDKNTSKGNN